MLAIHHNGEILTDQNGSVIFSSNDPMFIQLPDNVQTVTMLKIFILYVMGLQEIKRVKKIYYRYPIEENGGFYYKSHVKSVLHRYRLHPEDNIVLIRSWHNQFPTIHLLELFVLFVDIGESGSFGVGVDTQSSCGVGRNITRLMVNLNIPHDGSIEGSNPGVDVTSEGILEEEIESHERSIAGDPMTHPYRVNPTQSDDKMWK
ncbi:hypothetical protein PIB30_032344 [Stylosanthes scabra]|uniref:Uncharacterized protein n=1 Tax=Stylosanthes scabra TaxID=79078 RepID=A0ABU6SBV8_9FABA|nr:hypothetical protein [Stylosanthes scabra]